jgi:hypothetical protein
MKAQDKARQLHLQIYDQLPYKHNVTGEYDGFKKAKKIALLLTDIIISNNQTICGQLGSDVDENTAYWCEVELHLKNIITK